MGDTMRAVDRREYVKWISQYRWRLIGVFTFRPGLQMKSGRRLIKEWIHAVELAEGRQLSWLAMPERGKSHNLHLHVLIAGIHSRIYRHVRMWNSLAGHCHLLTYDPHHPGQCGWAAPDEHPGIDYAMKSLRSDDYDFDGDLHDQHLLPRFRKLAKRGY
jgi:hypothetical protein